MEMVPLIVLPFMGVPIDIGSGMLAFVKKFQQRRPVTHALIRANASVWMRIVVTKNEGRFIRSFVELLGEPVQLVISQGSLS